MAARAKTTTARTKKTTKPTKTAKSTAPKATKKKAPLRVKPAKDLVQSAAVKLTPEDKISFTETTKKSNKTLYMLGGLVLLLGLLYYFKDIFMVATVNGKPISRLAVVSELEKQNGKTVVDNLVTKELILQEAAKKGVTVSKEDIDNELATIEKDLEAQGQTLDEVLTMQGLSRADVEENLRVKLYIEKILADETGVTDEEAQAYFNENKEIYTDVKFEDEKDNIKESLSQQKLQEKFQTWITDLKANAKINYFKTY